MFLSSTGSLSVSIEPTWADDACGITEIEGFLSYNTGILTLEYRSLTREQQWSPVHELRLALSDLGTVEMKRGLFGWEVVVRASRMQLLEGVPGVVRGEMRLRMARRDRERAAAMVTRIQIELSELMLGEG